jgi:ABC-2 type transport system permease protein
VALLSAARRATRDRPQLLLAVGFYLTVSTVLATLWRTAAEGNGGAVAGYTGAALTWYVLTSEAAVTALMPRQIEVTGDDIASGAIAVELLRPASVLGVRVATEVGRCLPRLVAYAFAGTALAIITVGPPPRLAGALLALPALLLAVTCNLLAQHAFAAISFWIRDSRSAWFLYQKLVFILGGMLLPLQVLPDALETPARFSPFAAMAYVPARLASGHVEPLGLALQVFWLVVLAALARAVFAAGERRLQVVGG